MSGDCVKTDRYSIKAKFKARAGESSGSTDRNLSLLDAIDSEMYWTWRMTSDLVRVVYSYLVHIDAVREVNSGASAMDRSSESRWMRLANRI